jgi:hypothetical protein
MLVFEEEHACEVQVEAILPLLKLALRGVCIGEPSAHPPNDSEEASLQ